MANMAVITVSDSFTYNREDAILQEIELAKEQYHTACLMPYYAEEAADRYRAARERLDRARGLAYGAY